MYPGGLEPVYDLPGVAQRSLRDGVQGAVRSGEPGDPPAPQRRRPLAKTTARRVGAKSGQ